MTEISCKRHRFPPKIIEHAIGCTSVSLCAFAMWKTFSQNVGWIFPTIFSVLGSEVQESEMRIRSVGRPTERQSNSEFCTLLLQRSVETTAPNCHSLLFERTFCFGIRLTEFCQAIAGQVADTLTPHCARQRSGGVHALQHRPAFQGRNMLQGSHAHGTAEMQREEFGDQ